MFCFFVELRLSWRSFSCPDTVKSGSNVRYTLTTTHYATNEFSLVLTEITENVLFFLILVTGVMRPPTTSTVLYTAYNTNSPNEWDHSRRSEKAHIWFSFPLLAVKEVGKSGGYEKNDQCSGKKKRTPKHHHVTVQKPNLENNNEILKISLAS